MKTKYPRLYALLSKSYGDDAENEMKRMLALFGPMGMALEEASCPKPKVKTTRSEGSIKKSIKSYLEKRSDVMCFSNAVGFFNGYSYGLGKGTADLIGIICKQGNGIFFAIEVKEESWKPPKTKTKAFKHYNEQKKFLQDIAELKGLSGFANSLQDVKRILGL